MARKSRKEKDVFERIPIARMKIALYIRLSVENNGLTTQDSVNNQKGLLLAYANQLEDAELVHTFIDNGESGTDFDRTQWHNMMDEIRAGNINCVMVKDLSRFARNYIEAGEYIEVIFPLLGVRFIAVNDQYDSAGILFQSHELTIDIKNIVNDFYARDIAKKIRSSFAGKKEQGLCTASKAPYGYFLKNNQYLIDQEAAKIVKRIFERKVQGISIYQIARELNEEKIPSPSNYAYLHGNVKYGKYKNVLWQTQAVSRILKNKCYIGDLAAYEPIVMHEVFARVSNEMEKNIELYKTRVENSNNVPNIVKGILICGNCGHPMRRTSFFRKVRKYSYSCTSSIHYEDAVCVKSCVDEQKINRIVFEQIKRHIGVVIETEQMAYKMAEKGKQSKWYQQIIKQQNELQDEMDRMEVLKTNLYEDWKSGRFSWNEYQIHKQYYHDTIQDLQRQREALLRALQKYEETYTKKKTWIGHIRNFLAQEQLTREMVEILVEKIAWYPEGSMEISYKFQNEFVLLTSLACKTKPKEFV